MGEPCPAIRHPPEKVAQATLVTTLWPLESLATPSSQKAGIAEAHVPGEEPALLRGTHTLTWRSSERGTQAACEEAGR